jgi:hypothetical protein
MLIVHQLAGILLDMNPLDTDDFLTLIGFDGQRSLAHDRMIKLRNLIALRQIGIEIILAIEAAPVMDFGIDGQPGTYRLLHAFAVQHRQHSRHCGVDQRNLSVRFRTEFGRCAGEQLGVGRNLRVNLKADHDLPVARRAVHAIGAAGVPRADIWDGRRGRFRFYGHRIGFSAPSPRFVNRPTQSAARKINRLAKT